MKLYLGANSDGSEIISNKPIKRYIDYETNKNDVLAFNDTQQPPHWMLDFTGEKVPKTGVFPVDMFLTLPKGSIKRMFGIEITWDDDYKIVELSDL